MEYKIKGIYVDDICELLNEYKAIATEKSIYGISNAERVESLDTVHKIERLVATLGNIESLA